MIGIYLRIIRLNRDWSVEAFDPNWSEFVTDPYPFYRRLQKEDLVHYTNSLGSWWVTSYSDVMQVLTDKRFLRPPPTEFSGEIQVPAELSQKLKEIPPNIIYLNPPAHTRLRSIANAAFTQDLVERMGPRIEEIARGLLVRVKEEKKSHMDIISDYAFPLPVEVIADLFAIPREDYPRIKKWSSQIILSLDKTQPRQTHVEAVEARVNFIEYLKEHLAKGELWRKSELLSSLSSGLGGKLEANELYSMCVLLLVAAHENTTNVIGTGAFILLNHPDQMKLLATHYEILPNAVEEMLRYVSPVQRTTRILSEESIIGGKRIEKGAVVEAIIAAANRDPNVFDDPEKFDVTRSNNPHLAFGRGVHFCLGAPLARLEILTAFRALLEEFSDMKLASEPQWKRGTSVRGLSSLLVKLE